MFRRIKHASKRYLKKYVSTDEQDDSDFYRCRVCGFVCKSSKVKTLPEDRNRTQFKDGVEYTYDGDDIDSVNVTSGCPFCGTFYSK